MVGALPAEHRRISEMLVRARAAGRALAGPPQGLPDTLEEAYRLQDLSAAAWDDEIAGWKVGGVPPAYLDQFGESYLTGPIFSRTVHQVGDGGTVVMPVFEGGFAAIEPEFVFRLGAAPEHDRMFIGAEIASSPIPAINDHGPTAVISDFGNNNGLAIGPEIVGWRDCEGAISVETRIDGECIAQRSLDDFRTDALASLEFLRRHSRRRGFDLRAGTLVSAGAITGVHEAEAGAHALLDFGQFGRFELILVNAERK